MPQSFNRLALFDLDQTLVKVSKGHKSTFSLALKQIYGIEASVDEINHHGMTDQQVIIELLRPHGLGETKIRSRLEECMQLMADCYDTIAESDDISVLEGTRESLSALRASGVSLGLVTGNLERIGRKKLRKAALDEYFRVGAFGTDDVDRANLVRLAIKRAESSFGLTFVNDYVYLFGDTPADVEAGRKAHVKTIGVATGVYTEEQLHRSGADVVLESLGDKSVVLDVVFDRAR